MATREQLIEMIGEVAEARIKLVFEDRGFPLTTGSLVSPFMADLINSIVDITTDDVLNDVADRPFDPKDERLWVPPVTKRPKHPLPVTRVD